MNIVEINDQTILHDSPRVFTIDKFITDEECQHMITISKPIPPYVCAPDVVILSPRLEFPDTSIEAANVIAAFKSKLPPVLLISIAPSALFDTPPTIPPI